jgi:hypothetical protein
MTPLEIAVAVARALESIGVEYFLGGSMATSVQGEPRLTPDLDFVVLLRVGDVLRLKAALGPDFEVDEEALTDAVRRKGSWNIFHVPTVTRIDLFILKDGEYDAEEFLRKRPFEVLAGQRIVLKSPEDSVLRKLLWFRAGGEQSTQQFQDVVHVLRVQGKRLNEGYLDAWARKLDLVELLARARAAVTAA